MHGISRLIEKTISFYELKATGLIELASLTKTEVDNAFKRVTMFFEASKNKELFKDLEVTALEYGLSRQIDDRGRVIRKVNLYLFSERALSGRISAIGAGEIAEVPASTTGDI